MGRIALEDQHSPPLINRLNRCLQIIQVASADVEPFQDDEVGTGHQGLIFRKRLFRDGENGASAVMANPSVFPIR